MNEYIMNILLLFYVALKTKLFFLCTVMFVKSHCKCMESALLIRYRWKVEHRGNKVNTLGSVRYLGCAQGPFFWLGGWGWGSSLL